MEILVQVSSLIKTSAPSQTEISTDISKIFRVFSKKKFHSLYE